MYMYIHVHVPHSYCILTCNTLSQIPLSYSHTLRVWELNPEARKIIPTDCNLGQLKRIVQCIRVSHDDKYVFCGTTTGDILQVS